jgi:uncharacterized protein (TIGR02996 family)
MEEAFLRDICENPGDDAPRLVFADWLDEHGEGDRAEFIRAQCELARIEEEGDPDRAEELRGRAFALERGGRKGWTGRWLRRALPRSCGTSAWEFRRGFVEAVSLPVRVFLQHGDELFRRHPIREVRFLDIDGLDSLAGSPHLRRLKGLALHGDLRRHEGGLRTLLRSPHFPDLESLAVVAWDLSRALASLAACPRLEPGRLEVHGPLLGSGLPALFDSPLARRVTDLRLHNLGPLQTGVFQALAASRLAGALHHLHLAHGSRHELSPRPEGPAPGVVGRLLGRLTSRLAGPDPRPDRAGLLRLLANLRTLRIFSVSLLTRVSPLLDEARAVYLRDLDLNQSPCLDRSQPGEAGGLRHRAGLARLALAGHGIGDSGIAALAAAPFADGLVALDLTGNGLAARAVRGLVDGLGVDGFGRLRRLDLRNNPLGSVGVSRLVDSPLADRLWWLDLRNTQLDDAAALALAASARRWPRLAWLDLRNNSLLTATREQLRAAFGPAVRYDRW